MSWLDKLNAETEKTLAGKRRYRLYRSTHDRSYECSADSIVGLMPQLQFAVNDGHDGWVEDTRKNQRISLEDALEIVYRVQNNF